MEDILKSILGGASAPQGGSGQTQGDPLSDLLGGILGGALGGQSGGQSGGAGGMGGLLEGILGGGAPQGSQTQSQGGGGLMDILGMLGGLGGASQSSAQASPLAPIITQLAVNLGLDPNLAQFIVNFVLNKLLSGAAARQGQSAQVAPQGGGLDLDHLLEQMSTGQVDSRFMNQSGLTQELVQETGMDEELAAASLQQVFSMLGGQMGGQADSPPAKPSGGLEDLLDTW